MKWSWHSLAQQSFAGLVFGFVVAYLMGLLIDSRRGPADPDSTKLAMALGGVIAPLILAGISGWKFWALSPLLGASVLVAGIYSGNLVIGIFVLLPVCIIYFSVRKIRNLMFYYFPRETPVAEEPPPER